MEAHVIQHWVGGVLCDPEGIDWISGKWVGADVFDKLSASELHWQRFFNKKTLSEDDLRHLECVLQCIRVYDTIWKQMKHSVEDDYE